MPHTVSLVIPITNPLTKSPELPSSAKTLLVLCFMVVRFRVLGFRGRGSGL